MSTNRYNTRSRADSSQAEASTWTRRDQAKDPEWRRGGGGRAGVDQPPAQPDSNERMNPAAPAWRGGSSGSRGGRGGRGGYDTGRWQPRSRQEGDQQLWSTGDYRPLRQNSPRWKAQSRSPSPPPHGSDPTKTSTESGYTTPERRQKLHERTAPIPTPSSAYLAAASIPSSSSSPSLPRDPPILILDLNHTLLCRSERNRAGSKVPLVRPYLSSFLEYIFSPQSPSTSPSSSSPSSENPSPRFLPIVFSSARYRNVLSLLVALDLVPPHRLPPPLPPHSRYQDRTETYECKREEGDVLELVWTRENMGLNERDFRGDVETTKDLEGVWKALKLGTPPSSGKVLVMAEEEAEKQRNEEGARRTILLDDEVSKAAQQPYSLLPIKPFLLTRRDFPPLPVFNPKHANDLPPPPAAVELATRDHPAWSDKTLLSIIYQLDQISKWNNISHEVKEGGLERIKRELKEELEARNGRERTEREVEEEMERRGEKLIKSAGIQVRKEWDSKWRDKVLKKLGRN